MDQFSYYMIRVRRVPDAHLETSLGGIVERLGSGEKRSFADGEELLRLLDGWSLGPSQHAAGAQGWQDMPAPPDEPPLPHGGQPT